MPQYPGAARGLAQARMPGRMQRGICANRRCQRDRTPIRGGRVTGTGTAGPGPGAPGGRSGSLRLFTIRPRVVARAVSELTLVAKSSWGAKAASKRRGPGAKL